MRISPLTKRVAQYNFEHHLPRAMYVAPSCPICAFTNHLDTREYEFLLALSHNEAVDCLTTQNDVRVTEVHIENHWGELEVQRKRLALFCDVVTRWKRVFESSDIVNEIELLDVDLPNFEVRRLANTLDSDANWYLTRALESFLPMNLERNLRIKILAEKAAEITFERYPESPIVLLDPLILM